MPDSPIAVLQFVRLITRVDEAVSEPLVVS